MEYWRTSQGAFVNLYRCDMTCNIFIERIVAHWTSTLCQENDSTFLLFCDLWVPTRRFYLSVTLSLKATQCAVKGTFPQFFFLSALTASSLIDANCKLAHFLKRWKMVAMMDGLIVTITHGLQLVKEQANDPMRMARHWFDGVNFSAARNGLL